MLVLPADLARPGLLSALDADLRRRLAEDIRTVLRAAGTTGVVVTHDLDLVDDFDRVIVLDDGAVVADDAPGPALAAYRELMA